MVDVLANTEDRIDQINPSHPSLAQYGSQFFVTKLLQVHTL
jgi:hypothetical protein